MKTEVERQMERYSQIERERERKRECEIVCVRERDWQRERVCERERQRSSVREGGTPQGIRPRVGLPEWLYTPRQALRTSTKSQISKILSTSGDKCPKYGSKYGSMAPSTGPG